MESRDKLAFAISSVSLLIGLSGMMIGEEGFIFFLIGIALYWLYRYLNKDISFINKP